jgi:hypothetical protein
VPSLFFKITWTFFWWYFCAFFNKQQGELKNTTKAFWKSPCRKLFTKKLRGGGGDFVPVIFVLRFCFIAFLAVLLHEELKNTIKIFSKMRPGNLKKSQKKGR